MAIALSAVTCFGLLIHRASDEGKRERASRDQITAAFTVARSSFVSSRAFPEPGTIDLRMDDVRRLLDRGIQPRGRPTTRAIALVTARTTVDVTGQPRVPLAGNAVTIGSLGRATGVPAETGCIALTATGLEPQIGLLVHKPASLKFVPQSAGHLLIFVRRDGVAAPPIAVPVAGNNPVFVNFADPTAAYILQCPERGVSKLCGSGQVLPTSTSTSTSTSTPDPAATP